jgi:hypothetical protein
MHAKIGLKLLAHLTNTWGVELKTPLKSNVYLSIAAFFCVCGSPVTKRLVELL